MTATALTIRDLRRSQIVAGARRIVARDGLEALTIEALERELLFTRGAITYHFRGKDEIVHAVLRSAVEEIDAATAARVQASASPAERVHAAIASMARGFLDHVEAGRVLLAFWGRLPTDPRAARVNADLYRRYRAEASAVIRAGQEKGAFGEGDAELLGALLVGLVIGIATQAYFEAGALDVERAAGEAAACMLARLEVRPARRTRGPSAR